MQSNSCFKHHLRYPSGHSGNSTAARVLAVIGALITLIVLSEDQIRSIVEPYVYGSHGDDFVGLLRLVFVDGDMLTRVVAFLVIGLGRRSDP